MGPSHDFDFIVSGLFKKILEGLERLSRPIVSEVIMQWEADIVKCFMGSLVDVELSEFAEAFIKKLFDWFKRI